MYQRKLEQMWYDTYICEDGLMIDSVLWIFNPDVILLDIMLWKMNWMETCKVINEYYKSINRFDSRPRIIVFSNLNNEDIKQEFKVMWVTEYLLKSNTEPQDLVNYIQSWVVKK
jgi:CheY-like chemotaxis protein